MKTLAINFAKYLAIFAAAFLAVFRVSAEGHSTITGGTDGMVLFSDPPMEYEVGGLAGTVIDVYSARGTFVTEVLTDSNGEFEIDGLIPGSYTLVASNDSTVFPYFGLNLTGSYETATQTVSIRNKTSVVLDFPFVLRFIPT